MGFLGEGFRELRRKVNRAGLRRQLSAHGRKRQDALTAVGRSAWQAGVDLTEFSANRDKLLALDQRAGQLAAMTSRLQQERADLEARKNEQASRFDAMLTPARQARSQADAALKAAKNALSDKDRALRAVESKLSEISASLAKAAAPAAPPAQGQPPGPDPAQLSQQKASLEAQLASEAPARAALAADLARRTEDSTKAASEVSRIEAERRAAIDPLDAGLKRVQQEVSGASRDTATVGREQSEAFTSLGAALHERRIESPALAEGIRAVDTIDRDIAATQSAVDASKAQSAAMPRGTMALFGLIVVVVPLVTLAAVYGAFVWLAGPSTSGEAGPVAGGGTARRSNAAHEVQVERNAAVQAFLASRSDQAARGKAVEILADDILTLGSSAKRTNLPLLEAVLQRGEPELRAAAAEAIGMIRPTRTELPLLVAALNDPLPSVRDAAAAALDTIDDGSARLLVRRMRSAGHERVRSRQEGLTPTVLPAAATIGVPIYQGAQFLPFASDVEAGRLAFATSDPVQKVIDFYATAAGRSAVNGEEFTRLYLGGSPSDPNGARRLGAETEAWFKAAIEQRRSEKEIQAESDRRAALTLNLPLVRYADTAVYGSSVHVAFDAPSADGSPIRVRYVTIFQDNGLGRTGFELHMAR